MNLPLAMRTSGSTESQQVPKDGAEHHTTGAGTGVQAQLGVQIRKKLTEGMELWSNRELVPCGRPQTQLCPSNMTEKRLSTPG